jgi:hypothetical protein
MVYGIAGRNGTARGIYPDNYSGYVAVRFSFAEHFPKVGDLRRFLHNQALLLFFKGDYAIQINQQYLGVAVAFQGLLNKWLRFWQKRYIQPSASGKDHRKRRNNKQDQSTCHSFSGGNIFTRLNIPMYLNVA